MKFIFPLFFLVLIFSCHNGETPVVMQPKADTISKELVMKNAVMQYPDSLELLQNLVEYYLGTEAYQRALSYVNAAIARDSTDPQLWDMQSVVLVAKEDTMNAIRSLENAINLYADPQYIISLGALYAETKNAKALAAADVLLGRGHTEREAYFIKGLYYSFSNLKEKAIPFFDKALQFDPRFMDAYLEKALALYDLEKYEDAAEVLLRAVTLQNNFDRGYYYLGRCYEKLNRKEEAADAYRKALMYDPDYAEAEDALENLK